MTADVRGRLSVLEREVQRAIDLVEALRAENARLVQERAALIEQIETLGAEAVALRERDQALGRLEAEHRRLLVERRELLGQVEGILKELARLEGLKRPVVGVREDV